MLQQHVVHFLGSDFLPTAIDDLADAAGQKQVPVVVEETKIPSLEPIACKRRGGCGLVALVGRHYTRTSHDDLADQAPRQQGSPFVHERDVQTRRQADRTWLTLARR